MGIPKSSITDLYEKLVRDCRKDLKTLEPGRRRDIVEGNLQKAEAWIKFLSDPDVPELDDPKFKSKMKKLDTGDKTPRIKPFCKTTPKTTKKGAGKP